jgi:vitamin B12 transporter
MNNRYIALTTLLLIAGSQLLCAQTDDSTRSTLEQITVTATRLENDLDRSPSATTVITGEEIDEHQFRFATDALRTVPGLNMVATGTPGQLTSAFIRGSRSDQTQVLLDGIPINQGLSGAFNFADLTNDDIDRIEVVRGPQSALYGPRASGGVINFFTRRGEGTPTSTALFEAGSYNSFRETVSTAGRIGPVDFSLGVSRYDTDNARANNTYRSTSVIGDVGYTPVQNLRIGLLFTYDYAGAGSPNTIFDPRPVDNLRTEKWLLAPHIDFQPFDWWKNRVYVEFDQERQVNQPNEDGFLGPTRAILRRFQFEYQNDISVTHWLTLTSGVFYSRTDVNQRRLAPFDPTVARVIRDKAEDTAVYGQLKITPINNLDLYFSGRIDSFRDYGDIGTYRIAGNYLIPATGTIFRSSYATGFTPPSSQDKIFSANPNLKSDHNKGFDFGIEQPFWDNRIRLGVNVFHTESSNVIGFTPQFVSHNLGSFRSQGVEIIASFTPLPHLTIEANYTYLDARKTSGADISQPNGARFPRQPRQQVHGSISYLWFDRLLTSFEVDSVNARQEESFGAPNFNLEDFTVMRMTAEYRITEWVKIFGRIDNLADEKYSEVFGFPALGRTFYGGFALKF